MAADGGKTIGDLTLAVGLAVALALLALIFLILLLTQLRKQKRMVGEYEASLDESRKKVETAEAELEQTREELEIQVEERTVGVVKLNEQLNQQIKDQKKQIDKQRALVTELKELLEVKSSGDFLPICSNCKDIRDPNGYWHSIEDYIQNLSDSDFSHTLCPECTKELYPEMFEGGAKPFFLSWKPGARSSS